MGHNCDALAEVKVFADFFRCVDAMVEIRDKRCDCALEVDVVFPERVIGVDEQRLTVKSTMR